MNIDKNILEEAAKEGAQRVAEAFKKLSGAEVKTTLSNVEEVNFVDGLEKIKPEEGHSVVVNAQMLSGVSGTSVLILSRENALALVDLLNQQPVGTTGILKDIDRSALKETLNILSNSYINALSDKMDVELGVGVPNMITSKRLEDVLGEISSETKESDDRVLVFETKIVISDNTIEANLFIIFGDSFVNLINKD